MEKKEPNGDEESGAEDEKESKEERMKRERQLEKDRQWEQDKEKDKQVFHFGLIDILHKPTRPAIRIMVHQEEISSFLSSFFFSLICAYMLMVVWGV